MLTRWRRYEIPNADWTEAEQQIKKTKGDGAKSTVVAIKKAKRKAAPGETAAEIFEEEMGEKKRGSKKQKGGRK